MYCDVDSKTIIHIYVQAHSDYTTVNDTVTTDVKQYVIIWILYIYCLDVEWI